MIYINTPNSIKMTTYTKDCPQCGNVMSYINKRCWYNAKNKNSTCMACAKINISATIKSKHKSGEWSPKPRNKEREKTLVRNFHRNCPDCDTQMSYTSQKGLNNGISNKTICNSCSSYKYNKTFKDVIKPEHRKQMRASKAGFKDWDEYVEKYPEKEMYKREVWSYTNKQPIETLPNSDKRGRCGVDGAYQLDHIISINEGWQRKIPPEIIGHMDNLQILTWEENRKKW